MLDSNLLALAGRIRRAVETQDERALERIIQAFRDRIENLDGLVDSFAKDVQGQDLSEQEILALPSFKKLNNRIRRELATFEDFLVVELGLIAAAMITKGIKDAGQLMTMAAKDAGLQLTPELVDFDAIKQLSNYLRADGPLMARLRQYGKANAEKIKAFILDLVAAGKNPRDIAGQIMAEGLGIALTDALRMARTVQLYSYRDATLANYRANSDVVKGWVWMSALIPGRTCMSCVNMHGSIHTLEENLNDHHNGLCTMLPLIGENPIQQTGEAWFEAQSAATQRLMMGPGKLEAWKAGKFAFSQLSTQHDDDVYGPMRVEQSLKELVG